MTHRLKIAGWVMMMLFASLFALASLRYFVLEPKMAIPQPLGGRFAAHLLTLLFHVSGGALALVLGALGFLTSLREKRPALHRRFGRLYLLAVLTGGTVGLVMSGRSYGGLPTHFGFGLLALLWLTTGAAAYRQIRRHDIAAHREWMIRNYALTFSAVTLRLWLALFLILRCPFSEAYTTVSWLCWVPNLLIAELIIGHGKSQAPRLSANKSRPLTGLKI